MLTIFDDLVEVWRGSSHGGQLGNARGYKSSGGEVLAETGENEGPAIEMDRGMMLRSRCKTVESEQTN